MHRFVIYCQMLTMNVHCYILLYTVNCAIVYGGMYTPPVQVHLPQMLVYHTICVSSLPVDTLTGLSEWAEQHSHCMTDTCDCWNIPMVDALLPHASHGPGQDVLLADKP